MVMYLKNQVQAKKTLARSLIEVGGESTTTQI